MAFQKIIPAPCFIFLSALIRSDLVQNSLFDQFLKSEGFCLEGVEADSSTFISYYQKEMGQSPDYVRKFYFSSTFFQREILISLKEKCLAFEYSTAINLKRIINLDPGILCLEHVILATSKPYSHRPYLGQGVYAELVYLFEKGKFHNLPWCYPDYQRSEIIGIFEKERKKLLLLGQKK